MILRGKCPQSVRRGRSLVGSVAARIGLNNALQTEVGAVNFRVPHLLQQLTLAVLLRAEIERQGGFFCSGFSQTGLTSSTQWGSYAECP